MFGKNARINLNPSLALTFLIVAVTGTLMLFHVRIWGIKNLHEWMSVVFLVLCVIHLSLNWRLLLSCLQRGPIAISAVAVALLSVLLMFGGGDKDRGHDGRAEAGHARYLDSGHGK